MNKAERIKAAKERAVAAASALAEFDQATAAREAASKTFHARWTAFVKRSRVVMANLAGDYVQKALAEFQADFGYNVERPKGAKAIVARIRGGAKISGGGYGNSYSLSGLAPRLRLLSKAQVRDVTRAKAKMDRAQAALNRATQAWKEAKKAAFEAGTKMTQDELVAALVKREGVRLEKVSLPDGLSDLSTWRRDNLVRAVEQAGIHLTATRKGEECPCDADVAERRKAADEKAEAERRAALPKVSAKCPTHGKRRMGFERIRHFLSEKDAETFGVERPGWQERLPILRCPGGDTLVWSTQIAKDRKATEKARALAARSQLKAERELAARKAVGAKLPPPEDGDVIAFLCPACSWENNAADVYASTEDPDDPEAVMLVNCPNCGSELSVSGVARLSPPTQEKEAKAA